MFVKTVKNSAYYKRFQVRFRRRREGKTDYYQRKRLINQRKNKYNTPKYRFVVRRTNNKVICQVVSSTTEGDYIRAQAQSSELKKFGLTAGLTNFSASYATGLLCARRLLTKLDKENKDLEGWTSIATRFNLVPETTGDYIDIKKEAEKKEIGRPFVCYLDLGLFRSTKGARVFAAMKGAVDGGIHIPHSDKIFPSPKEAKKEAKGEKKKDEKAKATTGSTLRDRIFGVHVQNYINYLSTKKDRKSNLHQFAEWNKCLTAAKVKTVEELIKKVLAEVRKNPDKPAGIKRKEKRAKQKKVVRDPKDINIVTNGKHKYRRERRLNNQQRKDRVKAKIEKFIEERKKAISKKK